LSFSLLFWIANRVKNKGKNKGKNRPKILADNLSLYVMEL
jgi:hypothetical protein